jgi:outer membrane protein TolC
MRFLLSFILTFILISAQGQVYTLQECIQTGLERNFSILIARNTETIAINNFTPGNAGYLPSIDLNSRYNGSLTNTTQNQRTGEQIDENRQYGTSANAGIVLDWTIFSGFNVQKTYKKLNELKELGTLQSQLAVENLIADIITGYFNYIGQVKFLNNINYAVSLSKERLRIDEERYLLGSNSKVQVLQSRVYLNADSSRLAKQTEVIREAEIRLNQLMSVEDLGTQFISKDTSVEVNPFLLYEKLYEETLEGNTSLIIASKNRTISEYDYKIIMSRSYPYLNFSTGYSYNLNTFPSGQNKSQVTNGMNYGLTMGFNLFNGFNQRRNIANSSIDIKNQELLYYQIEQGIKADLITIYNAYSNNLQLIKLEQQNLATASENLEIALERYKLGSLSGIDLREVQKSLLDAKDRLLVIEFQTKLAEISLLLISGNIMDYYQQ